MAKMYRIWSGEYEAYWRPQSCGYTCDGLQAGLYTEAQAQEILSGVGPEKKVELREAVDVTHLEVLRSLRADWERSAIRVNDLRVAAESERDQWKSRYEASAAKVVVMKGLLWALTQEAANLMAHEATTPQGRGRTAEGRTVTALGYEVKKVQAYFAAEQDGGQA